MANKKSQKTSQLILSSTGWGQVLGRGQTYTSYMSNLHVEAYVADVFD